MTQTLKKATAKKKSPTKKKPNKIKDAALLLQLKGLNDAIFKFQYNKRNCDIYLAKRFGVELLLGRDVILYESFSREETSEEGLRDVYVAFVQSGKKPKKSDWRKFKTPGEVADYGKKG